MEEEVFEADDSFHQLVQLHQLSAFKQASASRRLSTASTVADERRLSAVQLPESHPVSPASSAGGGDCAATAPALPPAAPTVVAKELSYNSDDSLAGPAAGELPAGSDAFAIPAYRSSAGGSAGIRSAVPAGTAVTEERVTLNLWVHDDSPEMQAELAGMRSCVSLLQVQLDAARQQAQRLEQQAAEQAAAAAEATAAATAAAAALAAQKPQPPVETEHVTLIINVLEPAAAPAAAQQSGGSDAAPVQLVLSVMEQQQVQVQDAGQAASRDPAGVAADQAALQQQLQRSEACREELARQAGQLRGRIAKLEGAVLAGESRVKGQAAELEALKAANRELEQQLALAQSQVGVTPERSRAERQRLQEQAAEAQRAAEAHASRVERLEAVLTFENKERLELQEFTSLEHQLLTEQERSLAAQAAQWRADATAAAAQLADARQRLVATDAALLQRDDEVKQLRGELEAAQAAVEAAGELTAHWRQQAEQYDRDRQTAASNIRKAEKELDLVAQDNERMFRQLNYVRTRLMGQLSNLDVACADIGKLARELQSWCDREAVQRSRPKP